VADRILIVEDEANIASFVQLYLEKAGYSVERAATGGEGVSRAQTSSPGLILLDLNLPDLDGLEVCRRVRAFSQVPILMLTARDDDIDKIVGLEVGADDYVTKPFNPRELIARIKTILRRAALPPTTGERGVLTHGGLRIDAARREVTLDGSALQLAPKEFELLYTLLEHRGIVLTRDQLLERVWGYTFAGDTRTVDVHVRQLRRKIGESCPVVTVWGVGYKVADDAAVA
jgi:DNA-binding response OmpR family regulator